MAFQESHSAAYGLFSEQSELESILQTLNLAGFENEDLCVLIPAEHPIAERLRDWDCRLRHELCIAKPDADVTDGTAGPDASPECLIAWLASYGAVVIPEVALFVGSRQYMPALACPEELLRNSEKSVFAGLGISPLEALRYETRMHDKASFVFVRCNDVPRSEWARELLVAMGAEEASLLRSETQSRPSHQQMGAHHSGLVS